MPDTPPPDPAEAFTLALAGEIFAKREAAGASFTRGHVKEIIRRHVAPLFAAKPAKGKRTKAAKPAPNPLFGDAKKIPPLPEWVTAYSAHVNYPMDGILWCSTYEAKGWRVGKNRMVNWQSAVINWRTEDHAAGSKIKIKPGAPPDDPTHDKFSKI